MSANAVDMLQKLETAAMAFDLPFEVEYSHELLMAGAFTELSWLGKAERMFEVSALAAEEINNFHRALESLVEVARILEELNQEATVHLAYDYQEPLYAAMNDIIRGDLEYKQKNYSIALERYKRAYVTIASQSGYAAYIMTDRLRDLEWRLCELPPELVLDWCDALENEWLAHPFLSSQPAMLDLLERIRFEILK